MPLTADDRLDIHEVIALHGLLCEAAAWDRLDEVFADDLVVDAGAVGMAPLPPGGPGGRPLDVYIAASHRIGARDVLGMIVGNVVVRADGDGARAWSKGLLLKVDGSWASYTYTDRLVRTDRGWRIRHRRITPRREPGTGPEPLVARV